MRQVTLLFLTAVLAFVPGCWTPSRLRDQPRYQRGIVYVLPGIEGKSPANRNLALGLDEGGVRAAIEVFDWTSIPGLINLVDYAHNLEEARRLARRISAFKRANPGAPIHLVGHSSGGGIAVFALEALPEDVTVETAILLAPSISPDYNLTSALRRTRFGIVNFYSNIDLGFLGAGTTVLGGTDRAWGPSAGATGFSAPTTLTAQGQSLYRERLRQVEWRPQMVEYGAWGTHFGWTSRRFAREYLAPLLLRNQATSAPAATTGTRPAQNQPR